MYNSVVFGMFTRLYNHSHYLTPECFYHLKGNSIPVSSHSVLPPPFRLWQSLIYIFIPMDLPIINCFGILVENLIDHRCSDLFLTSIPLIYISFLMLVPHSFNYCSFVEIFEIWKYANFNFVLPFQDFSDYCGSLVFPYEF